MQHHIRPLRKKKKDGALYTHKKATLDELQTLLSLRERELERRCTTPHYSKESADFISTHSLAYLVRTTKGSDAVRGALFKALAVRITARARRATSGYSQGFAEKIVDAVVTKFLDLLLAEQPNHNEDLDCLECTFGETIAFDCVDEYRKLIRRAKHESKFESSESDESITDGAEKFVDDASILEFRRSQNYERLKRAIETLPDLQREIMKLNFLGVPVDSENDECIRKILKKDTKTIHKYLALALIALRQELQGA